MEIISAHTSKIHAPPRSEIDSTKIIEYEIIGEGSQILTNQKRENSAFSLLIG